MQLKKIEPGENQANGEIHSSENTMYIIALDAEV
jgi:hypothetical protein